ncbi:MAG TPA: PPOX class F420-dependent oxidoreductase [Roseiflexaceae bacterium]|nr:PPOX class F420-dependent oxidoreductase [Roseiflexaceae bacterium]
MPTTTLSDKARAFLVEKRFAVLATINPNGTPQLTTMWYELQGDEIMMNTKVGRAKEHNLRRDQRISICVEDGYHYVTVSGTARLIDDQPTAQADIKRLAERYHNPQKAEQMSRDQFSKEQRMTFRMSIERVIEDL